MLKKKFTPCSNTYSATTGPTWQRQWLAYHPVIGWWHTPNLYSVISHQGRNFVHRTNSLGCRSDREFFYKKEFSGTKRIVFLGDSYTAGVKVDVEQRYSDLMVATQDNFECLNFALPGSGTDQQLLIYQFLAKPFETDLYVWGIYLENIVRNLQMFRPGWNPSENAVYFRPKPYYKIDDKKCLCLFNQPVPIERKLPDELKEWQYPLIDTVFAYEDEEGLPWQLMRRIILELLRDIPDIPVILLLLPGTDYVLEGRPNLYLDRFLHLKSEYNNCYIHDVLPTLLQQPYSIRQRCFYKTDKHYTELGHNLVSQSLRHYLKSAFPQMFF